MLLRQAAVSSAADCKHTTVLLVEDISIRIQFDIAVQRLPGILGHCAGSLQDTLYRLSTCICKSMSARICAMVNSYSLSLLPRTAYARAGLNNWFCPSVVVVVVVVVVCHKKLEKPSNGRFRGCNNF